MEADKLSNHLPLYPDSETDEDYNQQIFSLHEYRQLSARAPQQSSMDFNHQVLTQVHLGVQTPNRQLFLFKDPGVGKTRDAIHLAETRHEWLGQVISTTDPILSDPTYSLYKPIVVTTNTIVLDNNFKKEIMTSTAGSYLTEALLTKAYKQESKKLAAKTKSIKTGYELWTHKAFANQLMGMRPADIAKLYSWRVIILDEVHAFNTIIRNAVDEYGNLYEEGTKQNYEGIMKLMNNVYGCVIVTLTATPIVNDIGEFPSVINFVLEPDQRITVDEWRRLMAIGDRKQKRAEMEAFLVPKLRGKISRVRLSKDMMKSVVRTNEDPNVKVLAVSNVKLWLSRVDNNNTDYIDYSYLIDAYWRAISHDLSGQKTQFYQTAIFADNMVWPGGTFGTEAIQHYIEGSTEGMTFRFTAAFMQDFHYQVHASRLTLASRIQAEVDKLELRKAEMLKVNPNAVLTEIDAEIAEKRATVMDFVKRVQLHPTGTFKIDDPTDPNGSDLDLFVLLYTIRSRYSPVYADTIEQIIGVERFNAVTNRYEYVVTTRTNSFSPVFNPEDKDNRECAYIFNVYKLGGVIPIGLFLEMFGYEMLNIGKASFFTPDGQSIDTRTLTRRKRYAFLYSASEKKGGSGTGKNGMTSSKQRKILELFNHPDNKFGHYLKVVAGTEMSAQSIDFKNIRQAHFTCRGWNEATNFQAEGRVDRPGGSHLAFDDTEPVPEFSFFDPAAGKDLTTRYGVVSRDGRETQRYVKVFRHVAYYPSLNINENGIIKNLSIGLKMYDAAAEKELDNSIPTTIMKQVAYDYVLNVRNNEELDDLPLAFTGGAVIPASGILEKFVTYNLFHARRELEWIKCRVRGHFKSYFQLRLEDLVRFCSGSHHSTVIKALTEMVNDNERILDRHGMLNYLREENDVFFLQKEPRSLRSAQEQWLSYYSAHNFVSSPVTISDLNWKMEGEIVNIVLAQLMTIDLNEPNRILSVLKTLSNKSTGIMVEILVTRQRELLREGKLSSGLLQTIFQLLDPEVVYAPANRVIVHAYEYYDRQERQAGGHSAGRLIPQSSAGELRVFPLDEGRWHNSTPTEDATFRALINDHINRTVNRKVHSFSHYGTSHFVGTGSSRLHLFSIQDKEHRNQTSSIITAQGKPTGKAATLPGKEAYFYQKSMQIWHLANVTIDLYVSVMVYAPRMVGNIEIKPMVIWKLKKDPKGTFSFGPVKLSPHYNNNGTAYHLVSHNEIGNLFSVGSYVSERILHITAPYPEILGFIFLEELEKADRNIMNSNNELFYPTMKTTKKYQPKLPPLQPGQPYYQSLFFAMPNSKPQELFFNLAGASNLPVQGTIIIPGGAVEFSSSGMIAASLNILHDYLMAGQGLEIENHVFKYASETIDLNIGTGKRFFAVWETPSKQNLATMIYLLYFLRGSIS